MIFPSVFHFFAYICKEFHKPFVNLRIGIWRYYLTDVLSGAKKKKKSTTKKSENHEQRPLEQNPEHRNHRTHRHCHHLRGNLVHVAPGTGKYKKAKHLESKHLAIAKEYAL